MKTKIITVVAAPTQEALNVAGATIEVRCDTVKEAKTRARYYLTEGFARYSEMSEALGYAQVRVDGTNVFDVGQ